MVGTAAVTARVGARRVSSCRSCGAPLAAPFLDLGRTPVANRLLRRADSPEQHFPLAIGQCPACSLVQLAWELDAGEIFDEDYPYFSSYSESVVRGAAAHAARLVSELGLGPESLVVEVGSNDGYLLQALAAFGVRVLGIDPSPGPAAAARARGIPTEERFFGSQVAREVRRRLGAADVVVANNVMAHVPDLNDFVSGLAHLVGDGGLLTVENPSVVEMIEHVEFDTIYHEHYCYFSCTSVRALFARHGLQLFRVEELPLHGGSLRWWGAPARAAEPSVTDHLERERASGVGAAGFGARYAARVARQQEALRASVRSLRATGNRIAAYGAAAKGATLLTTTGLGAGEIDFVVDRNVHKHGRFLPGARIPIVPVDALLEQQPDVVVLLAWNAAEEIVAQQQEYVRRGGSFLIPIPEPRLVGTLSLVEPEVRPVP